MNGRNEGTTENVISVDKNNTKETKISPIASYERITKKIDSKESLEIREIEIPEKIKNKETYFAELYSEDTIILGIDGSSYEEKEIELGLYNIESNDYNELITLNMDYEICDTSDKYIIFRLSNDNWRTIGLYIFDIQNQNLRKIIDYSLDEEKQCLYVDNYNNVIIKNDKVYFDDFYKDNNGKLTVSIYSYKINEREIDLVAENAQNPMGYKDDIMFFTKNEEGEYKKLYTLNEEKEIDIGGYLQDIVTNSENIFTIEHIKSDTTKREITYGVVDRVKNKIIYTTIHPIDNLEIGDKYLGWQNHDRSEAILYDIEKEALVELNQLGYGYNAFFLEDNYGIMIHSDFVEKDSKKAYETEYYFLKELE